MKIGSLEIDADMHQILEKLQTQLRLSNSIYLKKDPKPSGEYLMVQCPYHKDGQENHPSGQFRISDGLFYCHNCKTPHSLTDVIEYCTGENGREWLINNFNAVEISERKVHFNFDRNTKEEPKKIQYISSEAYAKYRRTHPYMFERKLDLETIRKYDIGYDEDFVLDIVNSDGVVIGHKHIGGCITFPNKDIDGNILFIARRSVNTKFFHYPKDVEKPVYGLYEIYRAIRRGEDIRTVYVCESMLDALYICKMGKWAVALNGTGSAYQYNILKNVDFIRTYILATDNDKAGKIARKKFKENVSNKLIKEIDYDSYKDCKDINEMSEDQFLNANIIGLFDKIRC